MKTRWFFFLTSIWFAMWISGATAAEDLHRPIPPGADESTPPNPAHAATIRRVAEFYRSVGMPKLADRVNRDFVNHRIYFDPNVRKENKDTSAQVNPVTNAIEIDTSSVVEGEAGPGGRARTIDLASTIFHEYKHVTQGRIFVQIASTSERETDPWRKQLQITRVWLKDRLQALSRAKTDDDRIDLLKDIAGCRSAVKSVVTGIRESINRGDVERRDLTDEKLDALTNQANRVALKTILKYEKLLVDPANRRRAGNFGPDLADARALVSKAAETTEVSVGADASATEALTPTDSTGDVDPPDAPPTSGAIRPIRMTATPLSVVHIGAERDRTKHGPSYGRLSFWNVGALVPGHGEFTIQDVTNSPTRSKGFVVTTTFSGGPNGKFVFEGRYKGKVVDGGTSVMKDGKTIEGPGSWKWRVDNPEAFDGWPADRK